ncbi:MAG: FAD-dependent oxidoreductase [Hyphomonadaceae bacterium]|nr:FAD-dependent oxidoreductase [Hyphomonadaceae bacterium]
MAERILILGAGITGLCAAMALAGRGREIVVLDRDPPPPDLDPDEAFAHWSRRGVTQLRHSHVFIGRLIALLRARQPALWDALLASGARESAFADALPPKLRATYRSAPGDEALSFLFSRRSTLELVMRRHAEGLRDVTFVTDAFVAGPLFARREGALVLEGVRGARAGEAATWRADAVIDAMGRTSAFPEWLAAEGAPPLEESSPAGILYFTRHYRLLDGAEEPPRGLTPGAGDLGYLKYGVFIADNRHFSVTLACPEIETALRVALPRADVFDAVCARLPGVSPWTDVARAAPVSKVFAMGALKNAWRRFSVDGAPVARGYFPLGDAAVRTNPLYGRGCSTGAIQAFLLGDIFSETADPVARLTLLETRVEAEIRPFFDAMVRQDAAAIRRAAREQKPDGRRPRWQARLAKSFVEDAIGPATRGDLVVLRALMRPFHMLEHPTAWMRRPEVMVRILMVWARGRAEKADLYPPPLGPARKDLLADLGLPAAT